MEDNNTSNTNTILIVLILIFLVGFGVWWFAVRADTVPNNGTDDIDVEVDLPNGNSGENNSIDQSQSNGGLLY